VDDPSKKGPGETQPNGWSAFRWLTLAFLSARRRYQIGLVLLLMFIGGMAELFTLGAVFPLLSILAGGRDPNQHSRMMDLMAAVGLNPAGWNLMTVATVFTLTAISAAAIRILLAWASQKLIFRIGYDLGVSLYDRMLHQPYSFHVTINTSRVIAEVTNIQRLLLTMMLPLMQALSALVISLFIFVGLMIINLAVALISFTALAGIYIGITLWSRPKLRRNAALIRASNQDRYQAVQEGLGGIRDVLLDNAQPVYVAKFARIDTKLRDAQAANALISATPRFVIEAFGMVLIVGLALVMSAEGTIQTSLPTLAVLALGAQRLMPLLQSIYSGWTNVVGNNAMLVSIVELLQQPVPRRFEREDGNDSLVMRKQLETVDLSFRYSSESDYVLRNLNMVIPKGSRIGLVGKSGSGKSTLTDLLMGLLQPTEGTMAVDGAPLDESNILAWQRQIAHVPQHIFLADSSILQNVAFGVPLRKIDRDRVRNACRLAELAEFIEELPDGYETMVGERGVRLSGGQRQRIGLARALYKEASVLVLDEATSALDDATEASVIDSVNRLGDRYTVVMIAHRLTTLRECDVIYRLANGRIEGRGTYAELIGDRRSRGRSSLAS
jgi:ABC-type bacteriocin/lantibiotic exporter with double-glycine peptidase domain